MYTLEELQAKTFKELKAIGYQIDLLPAGDKRSRQNWIDAIAGVQPPLLQLLEVSPAAEVEQVQEPIEIQRQEPIEIQRQEPPIESNFGRIVYAKLATEPIAQAAETLNGVESFTEADRPPNRGDGKGRLEVEPELSQSAIGSCASPVTFSPRFLAAYPPYFGEIRYKADAIGQLNLLEPETDDEPPDPDDFDDIDAFREAIARWDAEHPPEPLEVSMASMCEWAPCPDDWYEPDTNETNETVSCTLELSTDTGENSSTCKFLIPVFDDWCDRANRQNDKDEPPDTGIFARLPGPKPPKFPPFAIEPDTKKCFNANLLQTAYCIAAGSSTLPARSPPGGDVM